MYPPITTTARSDVNTMILVSEDRDQILFTKLYKQFSESEVAFEKLREAKDKEQKRTLWPAVKQAKDEVKLCACACI